MGENTQQQQADAAIISTTREMVSLVEKFHAGTNTTADKDALLQRLDPALNLRLKDEFNARSGIGVSGRSLNYNNVETIKALYTQALQNSDAPAGLRTFEQSQAYENSPQFAKDLINLLQNASPSLKGFSLNDAVLMAGNQEQQRDVLRRFPKADPDLVSAFAYTILDKSKPELAQQHPAFAREYQQLSTNFFELAALKIFYTVQDNQTYKDWESEKRAQIIDRIVKDPVARVALSEIRAPVNTQNTHDILAQYDAKLRFGQRAASIYSDVYGLKTLSADDIKVVNKSFNEFVKDPSLAYAWQSRPGVKNDEAVVINHNPVYGLLLPQTPERTDKNTRENLVNLIIEELEHTKDNILTDQLVNGEMQENHPARTHTSMIMLNRLYYINSSNMSNYNDQILERSAKETATDVTAKTMARITAGEPATQPQETSPAAQPTKYIISPSLFIPKN